MAQSSMDLKLFILLISIYILCCETDYAYQYQFVFIHIIYIGKPTLRCWQKCFWGGNIIIPTALLKYHVHLIHCIISYPVLCVFTVHIVIIFQILAIVLEIEWMISGFLAPLTSKHYHRQYQCAGAIAKCPFNQQVFSFGSLVFTNENLCHYIFLF